MGFVNNKTFTAIIAGAAPVALGLVQAFGANMTPEQMTAIGALSAFVVGIAGTAGHNEALNTMPPGVQSTPTVTEPLTGPGLVLPQTPVPVVPVPLVQPTITNIPEDAPHA